MSDRVRALHSELVNCYGEEGVLRAAMEGLSTEKDAKTIEVSETKAKPSSHPLELGWS